MNVGEREVNLIIKITSDGAGSMYSIIEFRHPFSAMLFITVINIFRSRIESEAKTSEFNLL